MGEDFKFSLANFEIHTTLLLSESFCGARVRNTRASCETNTLPLSYVRSSYYAVLLIVTAMLSDQSNK